MAPPVPGCGGLGRLDQRDLVVAVANAPSCLRALGI